MRGGRLSPRERVDLFLRWMVGAALALLCFALGVQGGQVYRALEGRVADAERAIAQARAEQVKVDALIFGGRP